MLASIRSPYTKLLSISKKYLVKSDRSNLRKHTPVLYNNKGIVCPGCKTSIRERVENHLEKERKPFPSHPLVDLAPGRIHKRSQ